MKAIVSTAVAILIGVAALTLAHPGQRTPAPVAAQPASAGAVALSFSTR